MKKAFLDLDGTLLNSKKRHEIVLRDILLRRQLDTDISDYLEYKADGENTKSYLKSKKQLDERIAVDIAEEWTKNIELDSYLCFDSWYKDSEEFLSELKKYGFSLILITARSNENGLRRFLDESEQTRYFDNIVVVSPIGANRNKSSFISDNLGDTNIVVGDTEGDCIEIDGRIDLYLLNRGFRSKKYWSKHKIRSYDDLHQVAEEIKKSL